MFKKLCLKKWVVTQEFLSPSVFQNLVLKHAQSQDIFLNKDEDGAAAYVGQVSDLS